MLKHSLFYRLLSNSFTLGWLFAKPEAESADYITSSYTYKLSHRVVEALLKPLYKMAWFIGQRAAESWVRRNLLLLVGLLIFLYFSSDIAINHYGLRRSLIELIIALMGLGLALLAKFPGIGQGSWFFSFFRWWGETD